MRRGFAAEELVLGYYRRLKPGGARVVRRDVRVADWLRVKAGVGGGSGDGIMGEGDPGGGGGGDEMRRG